MERNEPSVDIILPNYNSEKFIQETLDSILQQTYKNWRLIIVDDNSSDNSPTKISSFKRDNINFIRLGKKKGAAFCRNLGIRISNSKYVSFIDSDDYWSKEKLKKQISFMEEFNHNFTYTDYIPFLYKKDKKIFKKKIIAPSSFSYEEFINDTSIGTSSVIVKRSIIGTKKFTKTKILEDYFFKCQLLKKNSIAIKFGECSMFYRISADSLQSNKFKNLYWLWHINKNYNHLSILQNLKSILFIAISSIKKYGIK